MSEPFVREMWGPEDDDEEGSFEPSWEEVRQAIDRLGEDGASMVLMAGEEEVPHLCIGGGKGGQYILYVTLADGKFYSAVDPEGNDQPVQVLTGGELREFPARLCVGEAIVLRAARTFYESGELEPSVSWSDE